VWNKEENIKGSLFKMSLDSEIDENKNIVGYKSIHLLYLNAQNLKRDIKIFDGEYLINWL